MSNSSENNPTAILKSAHPADIQILYPYAKGGLSNLWMATHPELETPFLLKYATFKKSDNPYAYGQFEREYLVAQHLRHAGFPQIYAFNTDDDGVPYLLMEYCHGQPINTLNYPLQWKVFKKYICQTLELLHYCHQQNIIHRDIKPGNILISDNGCYIIDFGLALIDGTPLPAHDLRMAIGTPQYMAPEQAFGHHSKLCPATDLYELGITLFELCSGKRPFTGNSDREIMTKHCFDPLPSPSFKNILNPPDEFADFIIQLTQKDISRRIASASDALDIFSKMQ